MSKTTPALGFARRRRWIKAAPMLGRLTVTRLGILVFDQATIIRGVGSLDAFLPKRAFIVGRLCGRLKGHERDMTHRAASVFRIRNIRKLPASRSGLGTRSSSADHTRPIPIAIAGFRKSLQIRCADVRAPAPCLPFLHKLVAVENLKLLQALRGVWSRRSRLQSAPAATEVGR